MSAQGHLAGYTDPRGREREIVLRGRLILDTCPGRQALVVCELEEAPDERDDRDEVDAIVTDYVLRAREAERPLCRPLTEADLAAIDPRASVLVPPSTTPPDAPAGRKATPWNTSQRRPRRKTATPRR